MQGAEAVARRWQGRHRPTGTGAVSRVLTRSGRCALPLLLTACKGVQSLGTPPPPPPTSRLLQPAISAEQLMVARYTAAIKALDQGRQSAGCFGAMSWPSTQQHLASSGHA